LTGNELGMVATVDLDLENGSGFHTVTPGHKLQDLELADKYNLPKRGVIC
jgi:valyl-tRNA synthetase